MKIVQILLWALLFVFAAIGGVALWSAHAHAQTVPLQGGPWTPGHGPMYSPSGQSQPIIMDAGGSGGGQEGTNPGEVGITARSPTKTYPVANGGNGPNGEHFCTYDAPTTNATGYHYLCLDPNAQGGGLLSYGAAGSATAAPLNFLINGTLSAYGGAIYGITVGATHIGGAANGDQLFNNNGILGSAPLTNGSTTVSGPNGYYLTYNGSVLGAVPPGIIVGTTPTTGAASGSLLASVGGYVSTVTPFWAVPSGGTGASSFTANKPIIGSGTGPLTSGATSGTTTTFATTSGTLLNGDCVSIDSGGNLIDSGGPCGGGGGSGTVSAGTAGQVAYYPSNGTTVAGESALATFGNVGAGLVAAGPTLANPAGAVTFRHLTVSDLPNSAKQYGASASLSTTTGSISASSTTLTLASALDWVNGEYILVAGAGATFTGSQATGTSVVPQGTPGGTSYTYKISCVDANGGVGAMNAGSTTATGSNSALNTTNYNRITWTAGAGCSRYVVYRNISGTWTYMGITFQTVFNDYGNLSVTVPKFIPTPGPLVNQNDWLLTKVNSGGGTTTLTLAAAATNTVASATVYHEDCSAIQDAINALPVQGGTIELGAGQYNCATGLSIGNGTSSAVSTTWGVILRGSNVPMKGFGGNNGWSGYGSPSGAQLNWIGTSNNGVINIRGPVQGWGVQNLAITCNQASYGLYLVSASFGDSRNLYFDQCFDSIESDTYPVGSFGNSDSLSNSFTNIIIQPEFYNFTYGVVINGDNAGGTSDTDYNVWTNLGVSWGGAKAYVNGITFRTSDNNYFYGLKFTGPWNTYGSSVGFDYADSFSGYPGGNVIFGLDPGNMAVQSSGTSSGALNIIYGLQTGNGGSCGSPSNVSCHAN